MTTIHISQCYALHINVSDVGATGQRHIRIASTFTGAKDPQDQRVLFSAVVSPEVHAQIAGALAAPQQTAPSWESLHRAWTKIGADCAGLKWGDFVRATNGAAPQQAAPAGWIDPNDKTQAQYLPHIGEPVLFCCDGVTYYGKHTGGSFITGAGCTHRSFSTWDCRWQYPPVAHGIKGGQHET